MREANEPPAKKKRRVTKSDAAGNVSNFLIEDV
jgi:hypothetical protein